MRRALFILVLIGLIGYGLGFVAGPWFAFRSIRAAAQASDIQTLSQQIDFNTTRQSLRDQINPQAATPAPDPWHDPLGALSHAMAPLQPGGPDVDQYLTPAALVALTTGTPAKPGAKPDVFTDLLPGQGRVIRYWDTKRCRIAVTHADGRTTLFTFERRSGVDWKLVQIRVNDKPVG
jgi:hypothetical protein